MNAKFVVAAACLSATAALAQQPQHSGVRLPNCTQSMIAGTWHAVLNQNNFAVHQDSTAFACAITVAADGTNRSDDEFCVHSVSSLELTDKDAP